MEWERDAKDRNPALWNQIELQFPGLKWYNFKQKFEAMEKKLNTANSTEETNENEINVDLHA
jgi:hypothetical protein